MSLRCPLPEDCLSRSSGGSRRVGGCGVDRRAEVHRGGGCTGSAVWGGCVVSRTDDTGSWWQLQVQVAVVPRCCRASSSGHKCGRPQLALRGPVRLPALATVRPPAKPLDDHALLITTRLLSTHLLVRGLLHQPRLPTRRPRQACSCRLAASVLCPPLPPPRDGQSIFVLPAEALLPMR